MRLRPPRSTLTTTLCPYTTLFRSDHAIAAAGEADRERAEGKLRPLSGVPLGIKDLFATKGHQTTAGSHMLEGFTPTYESTVSGKLLAAGAGMLGKLNMDEFALGSSNEPSAFGNVISPWRRRSEEHTSELQSLMRNSYALF